uniref:EamA domain-containing protein n=1 Tax=Syphacia muris TaxID=451379 RepID=A0A0N5A8Y5_9BILA
MVQMPKSSNQTNSSHGLFIIGVLAVFSMCWTSAFAGVYFEKVLKKSVLNIWIENVRLGITALIFSAIAMLGFDGSQIRKDGLFHNWSKLIWLIALLSAVGGLTVSAVMKYADNIKKTLCQSLAIACIAILSVLTNDAEANPMLFCGIFLVVLSTYVYSVESKED